MQDAPREADREIRAEIERAVFFDAAREIDAGIFFVERQLDVGIGFVVAQQDVEFGLVLLDEIVLEGEGFALVFDDDGFEIGNFAGERAGFGVGPARFEKIGAHAVAERRGLCRRRRLFRRRL